MSATEWKLGDVAIAKYRDEDPRLYMYVRVFGTDRMEWRSAEGTTSDKFALADWHRRLVVLDPESAEDVQRLLEAFYSRPGEGGPRSVSAMQAALRELANPTPAKPDEPTGLGAVVEDRDGDRWVRVNTSTGTAEWRSTNYLGQTARWTQIPAVRVLSEGVPE